MSALDLVVPAMERRDVFVPEKSSTISALALSPDGRYCAVGDVKGIVEIFETVSVGNVPRQLDFGSRVRQLAWHELVGNWFLICSLSDSTIRVWAQDYGVSEEREIYMFSAPVHAFAISPSGEQMIVSCGFSVVLFDAPLVPCTGGERTHTQRWDCPADSIGSKHEDFLANPVATRVGFLGDNIVLMGYFTGIDVVSSRKPYKRLQSFGLQFPSLIGGLAIAPGYQTVTVTNLNNGVDFASLQTGSWIGHHEFEAPLPFLSYEASYLDDRYVVVGHGDNKVHIFDIDGDFNKPVKTIEFPDLHYEHMSDIDCVATGILKGSLPGYQHGEPVIVAAYGKENFRTVYVIRPTKAHQVSENTAAPAVSGSVDESAHPILDDIRDSQDPVQTESISQPSTQECSTDAGKQEGTLAPPEERSATSTHDEQLSSAADTVDDTQVEEKSTCATEGSSDQPLKDPAGKVRKAPIYEQIIGAGIFLIMVYSSLLLYFHSQSNDAFNGAYDLLQGLAS